jgi:VanZ family protein
MGDGVVAVFVGDVLDSLDGVTSTPHWEHVRGPRVRATSRVRPDHVLNVLFYIPFTPLGSTLGWSLPALVAAGTALSATAEGLQVFSSERSPDGNDLVANVIGTALGAGLVLLTRRQRWDSRLRRS